MLACVRPDSHLLYTSGPEELGVLQLAESSYAGEISRSPRERLQLFVVSSTSGPTSILQLTLADARSGRWTKDDQVRPLSRVSEWQQMTPTSLQSPYIPVLSHECFPQLPVVRVEEVLQVLLGRGR